MMPALDERGPRLDDMPGLTYRITGATIADGIETSCIEWTGQTDIEADEALAQQQARHSAPKKFDAIDLLKTILKSGPVSVDEINGAAESDDIAWATVRRAYDALNIEAIKEKKFQGKWLWHTPEQAAANREQGSTT